MLRILFIILVISLVNPLMAQEKLKNFVSFSDTYQKTLSLDKAQIKALDELQYELQKKTISGEIKNAEDVRQNLEEGLRQILKAEQYQKYQVLLLERKKENERNHQQEIAQKKKNILKTFKGFSLSEEQISRIIDLGLTWRETIYQTEIRELLFSHQRKKYEDKMQEIHTEKMREILSDKQMEKYFILREKQKKDDQENMIKLYQTTYYPDLLLNDEQAWKIYNFQEYEMNANLAEYEYLSIWEEEELIRRFMENVLNKEQYRIFLENQKEKLEQMEQRLKIDDESYVNRIAKEKELLNFDIEVILPQLCAIRAQIEEKISETDKKLIQELIEAYYTSQKKREQIIKDENQRNYKSFGKNVLHYELLKLKRDIVIPSFWTHEMQKFDTFRDLAVRYRELIKSYESEMIEIYKQRQDFLMIIYEKYEKNLGGWNFIIKQEDDDAMMAETLSLLVLEISPANHLVLIQKYQPEIH